MCCILFINLKLTERGIELRGENIVLNLPIYIIDVICLKLNNDFVKKCTCQECSDKGRVDLARGSLIRLNLFAN